jgi:hypothetical protein
MILIIGNNAPGNDVYFYRHLRGVVIVLLL